MFRGNTKTEHDFGFILKQVQRKFREEKIKF